MTKVRYEIFSEKMSSGEFEVTVRIIDGSLIDSLGRARDFDEVQAFGHAAQYAAKFHSDGVEVFNQAWGEA